jgi:hypothetical protein
MFSSLMSTAGVESRNNEGRRGGSALTRQEGLSTTGLVSRVGVTVRCVIQAPIEHGDMVTAGAWAGLSRSECFKESGAPNP